MKEVYLMRLFRSHYCKSVFLLSLILTSFLVPKKIFYGYYSIIGSLFILITSLTITCFIRNIKMKAFAAKESGASLVSIIMIVLGLGALQACTIGSPICGASIGAGFFALFFPSIAFNLIEENSILIVVISILIQILALYFMGCFKFSCKEVVKK